MPPTAKIRATSMHKPFHIVLTTIDTPRVLYDYLDNINRSGYLSQVKIWIIGDTKTPSAAGTVAEELTGRGLETDYMDMAAQEAWGKTCIDFYHRLPVNNEARRNIGFLKALEAGCEILISIDDDNYPPAESFLDGHGDTGKPWRGPLIKTGSGFHNTCRYLELSPKRTVFPRGFPFRLRDMDKPSDMVLAEADARIGVKAGLWTGAPDLDAVTWLNGPVESLSYVGKPAHVLSQNTWIPLSTQNLSVCRNLIPACLCVPMGYNLPGGRLERYGDVWGGYFLQALIRGTCYHAAFGHPVTLHSRNPHDALADLRREYWGMLLTDWLTDLLRHRFSPSAPAMTDRARELGDFLRDEATALVPDWCPPEVGAFMALTGENLRLWADACALFL